MNISKLEKNVTKLEKKMWWTMWLMQWNIAEDAIRRLIKENLLAYWIEIEDDEDHILLKEEIKDSKTGNKLGEYDIIAINHEYIVVVEVKNKIIPSYIKNFLEKRLPKFMKYKDQILSPEICNNENYKIIEAMLWLVIKPEMKKFIESKWLFAFTQNWDSFKIYNKKDFVPKLYW